MHRERTSRAMHFNVADAYIQNLKSHFGVETDDELARKIGTSKSTIASWRRRGTIPEAVYGHYFQREGIDYFRIIDEYFAERLSESTSGVTILLMIAIRLTKAISEDEYVDWGRWIARNRVVVLKELVKIADHWTLSEESISGRISELMLMVATDPAYGGEFLIEVRKRADASG